MALPSFMALSLGLLYVKPLSSVKLACDGQSLGTSSAGNDLTGDHPGSLFRGEGLVHTACACVNESDHKTW